MSEQDKNRFMTHIETTQKTVKFNLQNNTSIPEQQLDIDVTNEIDPSLLNHSHIVTNEIDPSEIDTGFKNETDPSLPLRNTSKIVGAEHKMTVQQNITLPKIPEVEITNVVGQGGMGIVYKGKQTYLDRDVAVKVMKTMDNTSFTDRFKREAKILASLAHPNIVSCYQAGVTDNNSCYIVMEFIEGFELYDYVRDNGPLAENDALYVISCLAQALQYAWEKGIMHRDVKSENVLLEKIDISKQTTNFYSSFYYKVKLVDLGLAKGWEKDRKPDVNITQEGHIIGTPVNMAPEQFETEINIDYRADIYALGCVLFFALTGQRAYRSTSIVEIIKDKLTRPIPDPGLLSTQLSQEIRDFTKYLLQNDMQKRPQTYQEIIDICEKLKTRNQNKNKKGYIKPLVAIILFAVISISSFFIFFNKKAIVNSSQQSLDKNNSLTAKRTIAWGSYVPLLKSDYLQRLADWQTKEGIWAPYEEGEGVIGQRTGTIFHILPSAPWKVRGTINSLSAKNRQFGVIITLSEGSYAIRIQNISENLSLINIVENEKSTLKSAKSTSTKFDYEIFYLKNKLSFRINGEDFFETLCTQTSIKIELFTDKCQVIHFESIELQQGNYE